MTTISTTTTISLPAGKALVFAAGSGQGIAIADAGGREARFTVGPQRTLIGPWVTAVNVLVEVDSGELDYTVDDDGDMVDQKPGLAEALRLDPTAGLLLGGAAPNAQQRAAVRAGMGVDTVERTPPSALVLPSALAGLKAYGIPGRPETWRANITADDLIDSSLYVNTYWVDADGGNDANSGLTWALRKQSISSAYTAAQASAAPARIYIKGDTAIPYHRALSLTSGGAAITGTYPVIFEAVDGRVVTGPFGNPTWTKTSNYYSATVTNAGRCFNHNVKDKWGLAKEYKWVASSAAVDAERGTWFVSGTTVYVRPHNDEPADIYSARVIPFGSTMRGWEWSTPANLFMRGIDCEGGHNGAIRCNLANTMTSGRVILDDCSFRYPAQSRVQESGTAVIDSAQIFDCGELIAAFNCDFSGSNKDGFNVHTRSVSSVDTGPFSLAVNCRGVKNGSAVSTSNQGFTIHNALHAASIGGTWLGNYGSGAAHANAGTTVWHCGELAGMTSGDVSAGGTQSAAFGAVSGASVLYVDHCRDVGAQYGLYNFDTGTIYEHGHKGIGKRSANVITVD